MPYDFIGTEVEATQQLAFHKPWWERAYSILMILILLGIPLLILLTPASGGNSKPFVFWYLILFCVPLSALFVRLSGPEDMYFDVQNRTYRCARGWPFFAQTRSGPLKDFWGVYVGRTQGKTDYFCVGVTWWGGGGNMTIRKFFSHASAERFATELMSTLELKSVMPPSYLRPRL